jgi:small subunit ribosomal protein S8
LQDLLSGNGKQGIDPRDYKKQLVIHSMDPLVDMFNRIRNALAVGKEQVEIPYSAMKLHIAKILERLGYVKSVDSKGRKAKRVIEVVLKYHDKAPAIAGLRKISRQGNRVYATAFKLFRVKKRNAIAIFSTSKGIMTDGEAREQKVGGEVLCEVW